MLGKRISLYVALWVLLAFTVAYSNILIPRSGQSFPLLAVSTGWGDIFVGVTAPIVGYMLWRDSQRFRLFEIVWCVAGITDSIPVLYKAVNSAPGPMQTTAFDLPTIIIGYIPFPIVPLLVVPISLILHIQMIRKLLDRPRVNALSEIRPQAIAIFKATID